MVTDLTDFPQAMPTTVLVVDDDDDTRDTVCLLLQAEGNYVALEAASAACALEVLRTATRPMVVLFDYLMPRVDGAALLALAEQALAEQHAFVCMTAVSHDRLPPTLLTLLDRYQVPLVPKPFDVDALLVVIRQAERRLAQLPASIAMPPARSKPRDRTASQE